MPNFEGTIFFKIRDGAHLWDYWDFLLKLLLPCQKDGTFSVDLLFSEVFVQHRSSSIRKSLNSTLFSARGGTIRRVYLSREGYLLAKPYVPDSLARIVLFCEEIFYFSYLRGESMIMMLHEVDLSDIVDLGVTSIAYYIHLLSMLSLEAFYTLCSRDVVI